MKQPKTANVKLDGGNVHYLAMGRGPSLLLLHSMASSSRSWLKVLEPLSEHFMVYALDTPGQGDSDKPPRDYDIPAYATAVTDFIDTLHVGRVSLMGNSMGAVVALEVAAATPARVDRLVLVDCILRVTDADRKEMLERMRSQYDANGNPKPRKPADLQGVFAHISPEVVEMVNEDRTKAGVWGWKASVAVNTYDMMSRLPRIECPTLLVYGAQDPFQNKKHILREHIPGAGIALIDDAGHLPQMDAPRAFIEAVLPFLMA